MDFTSLDRLKELAQIQESRELTAEERAEVQAIATQFMAALEPVIELMKEVMNNVATAITQWYESLPQSTKEAFASLTTPPSTKADMINLNVSTPDYVTDQDILGTLVQANKRKQYLQR